MDDQLTKVFNEFCKIKDNLNTSNVTEKTVNIIGRFGKAVKSAENIVLDPPKKDTSFDPELHLKNVYGAVKEVELKEVEKEIPKEKPVPKKKPGPKPKKK